MSGTCPTCNRDDFASERGMKLHHFAAQGQSIANRVEREILRVSGVEKHSPAK